MTWRGLAATAERWPMWGCELVGTGLLLLAGLSAVFMDFGRGSPVAVVLPSEGARRLLTGLLFGAAGSLIALTPLGRRSGAHLNPAVSVAFWTQRKLGVHELGRYVLAQTIGALIAVTVLRFAWGRVGLGLHLAATQPGAGVTPAAAAGIEALMTGCLILTILLMTSTVRTARFTPLATWLLVATLVWLGAPYTGTSLNPARSFAPALLAPELAHLWVYIVGPLGGAVFASALVAASPATVLTAKLFHDPRYGGSLSSRPAPAATPAS